MLGEEEDVAVVDEYRRKCSDLSSTVSDPFLPVFTKAHEALHSLNQRDPNRIPRVIDSLEGELSLSMKYDELRDDPERQLVYGFVSSLTVTLRSMNAKRIATGFKQAIGHIKEEINDISSPNEVPLEAPIVTIDPSSRGDGEQLADSLYSACSLDVKQEPRNGEEHSAKEMRKDDKKDLVAFMMPNPQPQQLSTVVMGDVSTTVGGQHEMNSIVLTPDGYGNTTEKEDTEKCGYLSSDGEDSDIMEVSKAEEREEKEIIDLTMDDIDVVVVEPEEAPDGQMNGSVLSVAQQLQPVQKGRSQVIHLDSDDEWTVDYVGRRKVAGMVSPPPDYGNAAVDKNKKDTVDHCELIDVKEGIPPPLHYGILKKEYSSNAKRPRLGPLPTGGMQCVKCDYITYSIPGYSLHLYQEHRMTPEKAGVSFECECGEKNPKMAHFSNGKCKDVRVVRIEKAPKTAKKPIDQETTPCFKCEMRPSTITAYMDHLMCKHYTPLHLSGHWIQCSCGSLIMSTYSLERHNTQKNCDGRAFTVQSTTPSF